MISADPRFSELVSAAVAEIEAHTDAEIVVVARADRSAWVDVAWKVAALAASLTLAFLAWSPFPFNPWTWPLEALAVGALAGWASTGNPALVKVFTSPERRRARAREAAAAAFVAEAVHGTRHRTGVLVYVAEVEGEVVVLPDLGVAGRVPESAILTVTIPASDLDSFLGGLRSLGAVLSRHLPSVGNNPDEIGNQPRILH